MADLKNRLKNLSPEQKALLEKMLREKAIKKSEENKIQIRENVDEYPMSSAQERLWFLNQLNPDSSFYNMPAALKNNGNLNIIALEDSLKIIFNRHEVLKSVFIKTDSGPEQNISKSKFSFTSENISEEDIEIKTLLNDEANKIFDIENGPLFRVKLFIINDEESILLLTLHHIIADGWSIGIIINELSQLYESKCGNIKIELDKLPIQYFDYAEWQKKHLTEDIKNKEIEYWENKLSGMPQVLELPIDKSRPASQTFNGARVKIAIPLELHSRIKEIGRGSNASPFMTYLAILEIVIFRFTNQKDFGIGTASTGRPVHELKTLIGFFVNTIVNRAKLESDHTFLELLKNVRDTALESFEHQTLPFESVVENVLVEKSISHTPLFQVMYDYQESPLNNLKLPGVSLELLDQEISSSKFDLLFIVEDLNDKLKISIEYNTDIFNLSTITSLSNIILNLIKGIVQNPNEEISRLPIISEKEKNKILTDWNSTQSDYPKTLCVHQVFEEQVKKTPSATAVKFGDEKLSYQELNEKSNQLANYLFSKNVLPHDRIALFMERSIDLIISTLAVLKVGAIYVPLDTSYPFERLQIMLDDVQAKLLITQSTLKGTAGKFKTQLLNIDEETENLLKENSNNNSIEISSDDLAYIMYTSGSTGKPKGVTVPHKAINRLVINTNYVKISSNDKIAQIANTSFDAATFEIWGALLNGAELIILNKEIVLTPKTFIEQLVKHKISIMFLTSALFNQIINEIPDAFGTINTLIVGGDIVEVATVKKCFKANPPKNLVNGYGPTENTTFSICYPILYPNENDVTIPIGKAISNTTSYILDENKTLVPIGVPGELYLGGDGLAKGYYNRDDITKNTFVKNPFDKINGSVLYKTGDLVRYSEDGNIEFIGRIDNQVKLRGFRIELGEIESAIKKISGVKDVVVIVKGETSIDKQLISYIVLADEDESILEEFSSKLSNQLPAYMIPQKFLKVETIPLTSNGKVNKKALSLIQVDEQIDNKSFVEPRNNFESYLAEVWQEILKVKKVSIHDSFFDLGGNSLQAAVLINRVQKELDVEIQVQSIFLAPTISDFSTYAQEYFSDLISEKFEDIPQNIDLELKIEKTDILTESKINEFNNLIVPIAPRVSKSDKKNPRAIFILSPPRSGSTLLRVMLEGHENLFSPPELDLLSFNTLQERKEKLSGDYSLWLEATIRAIMELKNCSSDEAEKIMDGFEKENMSVKDFYGELQELAGDRLLVDKTPTYALDKKVLDRAEEYFENPLYIHLTRNPYASIYSFIEAKLDKNFFRYKNSFSRRELASLIWLTCHKNTLEFLENVPEERQIRISFEDLVLSPEPIMKDLSDFLGLEYDEKLINPYDGTRMTDAIDKNTQMVGDFKFYLRNKIDSNVVNRWKNYHKENFLCDESIKIAKQLNYNITEEKISNVDRKTFRHSSIKKISRDSDLPLSYAQQRLWFLDQLEPGKATYNIPGVVELKGNLNVEFLEKSINKIVKRHESLRTSFSSEEGKAKQIITNDIPIKLDIIDLSLSPNGKREIEIDQIIQEDSQMPFDLSVAPLLRIKLLVVGQEDNILLLTMHHIIYDGWSSEVFVRELSILYSSYINGENPKLEELEFQYADFSVWQRNWLQGEVYNKHIEYWKNKLVGVIPLLELPTDFNRPAIQKQNGKRVQFEIDPTLVQDLTKIASKENVTLYVLFLAAFNILLYKYSKSEDILIGTPVAGRNRNEIEPIIGLFVNTLVLRNDFSKDYTLQHFLQNVKQVFVEAMNHQEIPFEKLVDELKVERSLSHTPLFQVMFVFNNSPVSSLELPDLTIQPKPIDLGISKFDINLVLTKRNEKIRGSLEYDLDLYNESTIQGMIEHFKNALEGIKNNLSQSISEIQLINESEKVKLLNNYCGKKLEYQSPKVLHSIFEDNLKNSLDRVAVIYKDDQLTFSELNKKSNRLANYIISKGVKQESLIAVCLERSVESIISIFAIWKAGAVYLPLDPSYPQDRLDYMVNNSEASLVITEQKTADDLLLESSSTIILSREWEEINKEVDDNLSVSIFPENLAYMIYTSGTTGLPKGVLVQHQSAVNLAFGLNEKIYTKYDDEKLRVSLNAPLPFDASMQEIIMLILGHTLVVIPEELKLVPEEFLSYVRDKKIDLLDCVPTQLNYLIEHGLLKDSESFPKIVLPGGEPIDQYIWNQIKNVEHVSFFNMYGPTECTVDSTICEVKQELEKPNIGSPIHNSPHYVLDENMQLAPFGIPGELYIGGDCLSRGYLGKQELTAERFLPNPFSEYEGDRIYKTGDLVRFMPDGNIEYLRRLDDQVKIRGFRIELGEIESLLNKHEMINQSIVIVREDEHSNKRLVAYIKPEDNNQNTLSELRNYLSSHLPDYMIPSVFTLLDEIPLLPNGKINKRALPKPQIDDTNNSDNYLAPETVKEESLTKIWEQILRVEKIGITDNFFELGGDSILGIQVIAKANQAGIKISPKNLFQFPTIQGLASVAESTKEIIAEQEILSGEVGLTPIQKWFFSQEFKNQNHWNQSILLEVNDKLEVELLQQTISKLIQHHDALRMRFENINDEWIEQYSSVNKKIPFEHFDLSQLSTENKIVEIEKQSKEIQNSLDIGSGPIFKCAYFHLGDNHSNRLLIVAHHLIIDGVSWRILTEDIQNIYGQLKMGTEVTLPAKTTSIKYWSKRLSDLIDDKEFMKQNDYWDKFSIDNLANEDKLSFPNINTESSVKILSLSLDEELTETLLKEVPKKYHTEINDVLLTALVLTNSIINGKRKMSVSLEGHGREDLFDDVNISRTIGWFTSLYPIELDLDSTMTRVESLIIIKEQLRKVPNNGIGYGILRHLLSENIKNSDLSHLPEISFNYLGQFNQSNDKKAIFSVAKENKSYERALENNRPFQMDITGSITNGKLSLNWMYNENKYSEEELKLFSNTYIQELTKLIVETVSESGGYTPSDFNDVDLDDQDLDSIFSELNEEFDDE